MLQDTATHCSSLQVTATHCNTLQHSIPACGAAGGGDSSYRVHLVVTNTICNTLQLTATHCKTLQLTATYGNSLQHIIWCCNTAFLCVVLPEAETRAIVCTLSSHTHVATHCNTLQHTATHHSCVCILSSRTHVATQCNTLQLTATHCNTLQHTETQHFCVWCCRRRRLWLWCAPCRHEHMLQHTATHYNSLQLTATHCNTLQHSIPASDAAGGGDSGYPMDLVVGFKDVYSRLLEGQT